MITKYLTAGLGVALLGVIAFAAVQTSRIGTLKAEKRALETEHMTLADSCQGKDMTITQLETAVSDLTLAAQADAEALGKAAVAITGLRDILRARDAQLDDIERGDYEIPECSALLALDLNAVCPGVARSLRERAGNLPR